jgi:hypothetical protein
MVHLVIFPYIGKQRKGFWEGSRGVLVDKTGDFSKSFTLDCLRLKTLKGVINASLREDRLIAGTPIDPAPSSFRELAIFASVAALVTFAGCALTTSHQVKADHQQLRDVLMDYVEDQIMDNLIRAYNGLPIAHFDFSHISAVVASKFTPQVAAGRTVTDVSNKAPNRQTVTTNTVATSGATTTVTKVVGSTVAAIGGVAETVAKPFTYGASAERDNTIDVEVAPVLNEKELYAAYLRFLNRPDELLPTKTVSVSKKNTDGTITTTTEQKELNLNLDFSKIQSLQRTPDPPSDGQSLICRRWKRDGLYYWVPMDYKAAFFRLSIATVARSAPPKQSKDAQALESQFRQFFLSQ